MRTEIINYCVDVVDQSIDGKRKTIENEDLSPEAESHLKNVSYAEEVKVRLIIRLIAVINLKTRLSLSGIKSIMNSLLKPL